MPSEGDFYLRFSAVAWCYQWYKAAKQKIGIQYDDCFFNCPVEGKWDEHRRNFCDDCPQRKEKDKFFTDTQAVFQERFREELFRSKFDKLVEMVKNVAAFEGSDEDIGVKHSHLLTGYLSEKDKYERATRPKA